MNQKTAHRFWRKVDLNGPVPAHAPHLGPCHVWVGATRNGYGALVVGYNAKRQPIKESTHRLAWIAQNSPIPDGLFVCHKCDNRLCVRADHLFLGTIQDNNADRVRKDRGIKGDQVNTCKLTEDQAREIVRLYGTGVLQKELARMFGIAQSNISSLVRGETWKHLKLVQR